MGHIRLGVLPKYPRWKGVISLLEDTGAPASRVADKVLDVAKEALAGESAQSSVSYCIWLLAQLALASRTDSFSNDLATLGIHVSGDVTAAEFLAVTGQVATRELSGLLPHTILNGIAGLALQESLARTVATHATTLFGAGLTDVQFAFRGYSTSAGFSRLLHVYFTAFLGRTLRFIVDKEIANHLGSDKRFENARSADEFEGALESFAGKTTRIVDAFSGGWYSKKAWERGDISLPDAAGFVHVALNKLRADLALSEADE